MLNAVANTRRVGLVPAIHPSHVSDLYDLVTSPTVAPGWRYRGWLPTRDQFLSDIESSAVPVFAMCLSGGRAFGLATTHLVDFRHGTCFIAAATVPDFLGTGLAVEGMGLFVHVLFTGYPFRKLLAELPVFNRDHLAGRSSLASFQLELTLPSHRYSNGRYWDVDVYGCSRDAWADDRLGVYIRRSLLETARQHEQEAFHA